LYRRIGWRFFVVIKILKWGNSLGLRIPKSFAKEAGVEQGSPMDISLDGGRLVIRPVHPAIYKLSEMLSRVREDNIHKEVFAKIRPLLVNE
jgi:antitoxin MazE